METSLHINEAKNSFTVPKGWSFSRAPQLGKGWKYRDQNICK